MTIGTGELHRYGFKAINETNFTSSATSVVVQVNDVVGPNTAGQADLVCVAGSLSPTNDGIVPRINLQRISNAGTFDFANGGFRTRSYYTTSTYTSQSATYASASYYNCGNINATSAKNGERIEFLIWIKYHATDSSDGRPFGDVSLFYNFSPCNPYVNASFGGYIIYDDENVNYLRILPNSGSWAAGRVKVWHFGASE